MPYASDVIKMRLWMITEARKDLRRDMATMDLAAQRNLAEFTYQAQIEITSHMNALPFTPEGYDQAVAAYKTKI